MSHCVSQSSFADLHTQQRLEKIHELSPFLLRLQQMIDWETFRPQLLQVREKPDRINNAGRHAFDVVLMFKILVLQALYNLSDEQTELQVRDRISFMNFLDLSFDDTIPDAKTLWLFKEQLKNRGLERVLFERFHQYLASNGVKLQSGLIVDSSFVEVPKQRNTKEENEHIKNGKIPQTLAANPLVLAQKDTDASWTKKGEVSYFGYKDHVLSDAQTKLIADYDVTSASVHDSVPFLELVPEQAAFPKQPLYADAAYVGAEINEKLQKRGYDTKICAKGYRNHPLTDAQKASNHEKSKVRCRVEHIFGSMKMRVFGNETLRTIGIGRAKFGIGMRNLVYNMTRYLVLKSAKPVKSQG